MKACLEDGTDVKEEVKHEEGMLTEGSYKKESDEEPIKKEAIKKEESSQSISRLAEMRSRVR